MAPEILNGSQISQAGATLDDMRRVDMWAYSMLLFNLLNPDLLHRYEDVIREDGKGDTKEKIVRFLRRGRILNKTRKYAF